FALVTLIRPSDVNPWPFRPFLVGRTQSNISTPRSTPSHMSSGCPIPIMYRGESSGKREAQTSVIRHIDSFGSPKPNPPIAYPGNPISTNCSTDFFLRSSKVDPCTIPNNKGATPPVGEDLFIQAS